MTVSRGYVAREHEGQGEADNFAVEPKVYVDESASFGFTKEAEKLNGRAAMIGFISLLVWEVATGQGLLTWLSSL